MYMYKDITTYIYIYNIGRLPLRARSRRQRDSRISSGPAARSARAGTGRLCNLAPWAKGTQGYFWIAISAGCLSSMLAAFHPFQPFPACRRPTGLDALFAGCLSPVLNLAIHLPSIPWGSGGVVVVVVVVVVVGAVAIVGREPASLAHVCTRHSAGLRSSA